MPWFPEFLNAAELARRHVRAAGQADPVGQYLAALNEGDVHALEDVWPGEVAVYDPRAGEVRGHRELRRFVVRSRELLAGHRAHIDAASSIVAGDRAVVELMVRLEVDGRHATWPVAVVAQSSDDRSVVFRSYLCQRTVFPGHYRRPPILKAGSIHPGDVVGRYLAALSAGDAGAVAGTFAPDGYLREPIAADRAHRGTAALRAYFEDWLRAGGVDVECCAVTDDGVRCAVEYNVVRWGGRDMPPQAGIAVFERAADGLLASAHLYDDVEAPATVQR